MTHQIWAAAFLGVLFAVSLNRPPKGFANTPLRVIVMVLVQQLYVR